MYTESLRMIPEIPGYPEAPEDPGNRISGNISQRISDRISDLLIAGYPSHG